MGKGVSGTSCLSLHTLCDCMDCSQNKPSQSLPPPLGYLLRYNSALSRALTIGHFLRPQTTLTTARMLFGQLWQKASEERCLPVSVHMDPFSSTDTTVVQGHDQRPWPAVGYSIRHTNDFNIRTGLAFWNQMYMSQRKDNMGSLARGRYKEISIALHVLACGFRSCYSVDRFVPHLLRLSMATSRALKNS